MVKDECGLVHLTEDQKHLVVYELFVLSEAAAHMLLQLVTDLWMTIREGDCYINKMYVNSIFMTNVKIKMLCICHIPPWRWCSPGLDTS